MFLSKIWFILIALRGGGRRDLRAHHAAPVRCRSWRRWRGSGSIARSTPPSRCSRSTPTSGSTASRKLGRDAIISESLDAASTGSGEYTVIHRTIQDRFRTLIPDLASGGIDSLVADRQQGPRHRARRRKREGIRRQSSAAPRSSRTRCAATSPTTSGERAAGCSAWRPRRCCRRTATGSSAPIYVSAETGPALVERLKKNLDVDIALLLRGKVIAPRAARASWTRCPRWSPSTPRRSRPLKRTAALELTAGKDKLLAVAAPFPGTGGRPAGVLRAARHAAGQDRSGVAARRRRPPTTSSGATSRGCRWPAACWR